MVKSAFTDEYKAFLGILVSEREAARLTQQTLADRLGKPQSFVSKYERGERRLDVIEFIAVVFAMGADPYEVIGKVVDVVPPGIQRADQHTVGGQ